jgi:CrcB protein
MSRNRSEQGARSSKLEEELSQLGLVAAGAIPGALLRWHLEQAGEQVVGGLPGLVGADFLANMIGCLLIGMLVAQPPRRARLYLWAAIGFCGSLTTFSSWMLELARALDGGHPSKALAVLVLSLVGGLVLVVLGYGLARRFRRE